MNGAAEEPDSGTPDAAFRVRRDGRRTCSAHLVSMLLNAGYGYEEHQFPFPIAPDHHLDRSLEGFPHSTNRTARDIRAKAKMSELESP